MNSGIGEGERGAAQAPFPDFITSNCGQSGGVVIGHVCSFNCTGGMQRTGSASATCKKEGDMAVFILDSVHKLPAECIMPEATAAQLGTSDQDICEDFKCGFECAKFQEDLGCGWSTAVGKCKKGATTTPEEMTAGKCDHNN